MLIEEVDYLKQWLITQLQAISEADPSVLAKYVIALLKKDDVFHQETFIEQLEVFLDDATVPFVRNLYEVMQSKEYLPIPPKKKRVFTETPSPQEEHKTERKVSIEPPAKTTEQRMVELSIDHLDDDDKLNARKRRFDDERSHRKRGSRNVVREEEFRRYNTDTYEERGRGTDTREVYDERSRGDNRGDNRGRYNERVERTRSDERERYGARVHDRVESTRVHDRVGYPKPRRYSRSPTPPRRSRSPRVSMSPPRNGKSRKERCRDFDEKGYCLRGGLCQYDHGTDPVVVEESSLSTVLQAANTPIPPPPQPPTIFSQTPIFPPGETYNPDKPGLLSSMVPPLTSLPLPPPPPVTTVTSPPIMSPAEPPKRPYIPTVRRAPSSTGQSRSFKLVDGSNIITGTVNPVETDQTTLIIRDIPYTSNDGALLSKHLGAFGPIRHLQCKVYNDNHTAIVEYHSHTSATACFNSTEALLQNRFIKVYWKEVVPISLAPAYFTNTGKLSKGSIHQSMNLVNTPAVSPLTTATTATSEVVKPPPKVSPPPPHTYPYTSKDNNKALVAKKRLELTKRTQELLDQNVKNQKLILSKLEKSKVPSEKRTLLTTLKKLQESHKTIKSSLTGTTELGLADADRKRKTPPAPRTTRGANTNLDLRPREILVKNCNNAEELQEHFSKFGVCTVIPSGVGVIIGFDKRKDAEMAYVKGRIVDNQELDIEWNKTADSVQSSQVTVEPIR